MTRGKRFKRSVMMLVWPIMNPPNRLLARSVPWWVVIETTGRRTGERRSTPLARGPIDGQTTWLISVHGRHASWVKNLKDSPTVRLPIRRRWHTGTAAVIPYDPEIIRRFNRYARLGPATLGIDPALVRIDLERSC
jgi:deazaflavin-dependent oxidoreductase (nitroreductase family)